MKDLTVEQVQELYDFLRGKELNYIPIETNAIKNSIQIDNDFNMIKLELKAHPCLSKDQAFSTIYTLQEYFNIISQDYEICEYCDSIFDTNNSGHHCNCDECEQIESCEEEHGTTFDNIKKALNSKYFCSQECEQGYLNEHGE